VAAPAISAMHVQVVLESAARAGVARAELLLAAGLSADQLAAPEAIVPLTASLRLWREAAARTKDPCFGLHAGEAVDPRQLGALGYVLMSSATVHDAIDAAIRYERLMYSGFTTTLRISAGVAVVRHSASHASTPVEAHPIEFTLATILTVCRRIAGENIQARAVRLRHAAPHDTSEYERVFGVRPEFAAEEDALVLDAPVLAYPVRSASADVLRSVAPIVERIHTRILGNAPVTDAACVAIAAVLRSAVPTLGSIARVLVMSERSLQRKLLAEGTSFAGILDRTRRELALDYLANPALPIGEVAFLTGFRDASAFHKATRRWTGLTPAQIRQHDARVTDAHSGMREHDVLSLTPHEER
jgi:AraC-like DNA-binding protein